MATNINVTKCNTLAVLYNNYIFQYSYIIATSTLYIVGRKKRSDIGKVYNEVGVMRQGKEAVEVWRRHFEMVLNEGRRSEGEGNDGGEEAGSGLELLNEAMTREEVVQALVGLKRKLLQVVMD